MTPLPGYVQIEPVGQCNLRCRMCPIQFRQEGPPHGPPAFMAFETFTRLLAQFTGATHVHLQGLGEPMLHPRFFDMVRHAKARGLRVTTNTNLSVLDAAECLASGLDELHGSLDGARPETYERSRPRAKFDRAVANVRDLVAARAAQARAQPRIELVMVVMRDNVEELPELVRLAHDIGVDSLFVQHLCHDFGESALPAQYAPLRAFVAQQTLNDVALQRVEPYFAAARALASALDLPLRLPRLTPRPHPPGTPGRKRCDWPWRGAYVTYRGEAMPCCMIATPDRLNFGDMATHGVAPVWNSAAYEDFRRRLASDDDPPDVCRACALYAGTF